jgi:hypothetical protein
LISGIREAKPAAPQAPRGDKLRTRALGSGGARSRLAFPEKREGQRDKEKVKEKRTSRETACSYGFQEPEGQEKVLAVS